uniref:VWFA domain-containing protein n=1 Tax=Panagrolaimus sp. PS1159 TaxID=55785 RepID=A0AC35G8Q3_9BILA
MQILKWLILIAFLDSVNCFATTEAFAAVLDIFHDTRFHDTQMATALCITQYRFLQRNIGLTAREPALYESCPYSDWFLSVSEYATAQKVKLEFMYYVNRPDIVEALKSNPITHFDAESFISGSNHNLIQSRQTVFKSIKRLADIENDIGSIRQLIGQSIHTLQDFYSHTNWVEMGYKTINSRVGEDSYLGLPVNQPHIDACRACTKDEMSSGEQAEFNRIKSSIYNNLLLGLLDFSFDNVYVCRNNIIVNNFLTSGYYSSEASVAPKPKGKCSHGGGTDSTDATCAPGGISKDADTFIFAPHYYLHSIAANLSVQATIRYFEDLRLSIGDEKLFGLIIGMSKYTSLAFIVDTTSSMQTSITATRLYIKSLLDNTPNDALIFVTLFSDSGFSNIRQFSDKPEVMAYLFSFTPSGNASSSNPSIQNQIQAISNQKKLQINFILSGAKDRPSYRPSSSALSPTPQPYRTTTSRSFWDIFRGKRNIEENEFKGFRRLARATNGIFIVPKDSELPELGRMSSCGSWETIMVIEDFDVGCGNNVWNWTIPIDESIATLEVSFALSDSEPNSTLENLVIIFTDAAGGRLHPSTETLLISTASTRIYRFEIKGERAIWHVNFGQMYCPPSPPVTINVRAESYLISNVMFFDSNYKKVENQPIVGGIYTVFIDCPDCSIIDSITFNQCGIAGGQGSSRVERTTTNGWFFVNNITLPQTDLICVEFSGKTKMGTKFLRVHRKKISPSPFVLTGRIFSQDFPGDNRVYQKRNATLAFQIENFGEKDTVEITVDGRKSNKCKIKRQTITLEKGQIYHGIAEIEADGEADEIDNIDREISPKHFWPTR